jgi:nucleotide-binding universal stress UspA family protein
MVVEPISAPSIFGLPGPVRAVLAAELAAANRERMRSAGRELSIAARRLTRAGWAVEKVVRRGIPTSELLKTASSKHTDITVVGARGATGLKRLLLGSVAEGTLVHSPGPVLVVK